MTLAYVCTTFAPEKSSASTAAIRINRVKSAPRSVTTINTSSGSPSSTAIVTRTSVVFFSGSEDSWFYIWKTEPNNALNHRGASAATSKLTRKQRRHFDRAFERIRGEHPLVSR